MMTIVTVERYLITDRASWLAMRQQFLTASDIGAVFGVDRFKTPLRVYAEKTMDLPAVVESGAMRRGRLFEKAAIAYLEEENPGWVIEQPGEFVCDPVTRLGCTPDAILNGTVNVQIKTVSKPSFERWNGVAPLSYHLQVATENMLLDAERGILAVLVVSAYDAFVTLFDVPRHAAAEAKIVARAREFWDNIATGRRPPADYSRDAETITAMFPHAEPDRVVDLSGDNRLKEILPRREELKDGIDGFKKELEGLDAEVKFKLGDAAVAELPGWRMTWKDEPRKGYTVQPSVSRPLRVKQLKNDEEEAA